MKTVKADKDVLLCIFAMFISAASYGFEKIIELIIEPSRVSGLVLAMIYTVLLGCVVLILVNCNNTFYGLLTALIAYKMIPVNIVFLGDVSPDGNVLYYILKKAAVLIFIVLIYKLYNMQPEPKAIKPLPVIAMLALVPFFTGISSSLSPYLEAKTGSMMLSFFTQYLCYFAAAMIILALSYISNYETMRFAMWFELTALSINIIRRVGKIAVKMHWGHHISKSLYVWIVVYVAIAIIFVVATLIKKKSEPQEA